MQKLDQNIAKLYVGGFLSELIFFIPIMVPFFGGLGFSLAQILLLEAAFAVSLVLLEIPSGYFADIYGRRKALVIGSVIELIGVVIFVFSNAYEGFFLGEIIFGIGASLVSGSREALLYDTLLELKKTERYKKLEGGVYFYQRMASVLANILGAILATYFLRLPFYVTLAPLVLWVIVNLTLVEPHRHKSEIETWPHFKSILKDTFASKKLTYFIAFAAIPSAFFLMTFWLYQRYMEFIEIPIFFFGFIIAGMNIASGFAGKYSKEIEEMISPKISLVLIPILPVMLWVILANFEAQWLVIFFFITSALWGFFSPLFLDFLQKMTTSDRRATVMSIRSFLVRGLFLILGPFLGLIADFYSIQTAFLMSAAMLFVLGSITLLLLKRVKIL